MRGALLISACLLVATLAAYWPVHRAEFISFDDPVYVTNNPEVFHGLTAAGLVWAFKATRGSNWHPLTWLSHMVDCQLFGENAGGHHVVSVGFHAANAVLLFILLWRLTGRLWPSGFVAALFALHPLHVESVAWVSERKDVLSTCFGFLTLLAYARYAEVSGVRCQVSGAKKSEGRNPKSEAAPESESRASASGVQSSKVEAQRSRFRAPRFRLPSSSRFYVLSLVFFALGLMSKPMLVTLPFLLLLLDYWPLRRLRFDSRPQPSTLNPQPFWPLLREKLPFFALALASSWVTFQVQKTGGAVVSMEKMPLVDRLGNAALACLMYIVKAFWPTKLAVYYPFPPDFPATEAILSAVVLIGATLLAVALARRAPYVTVGWLWFVGMLVPVIGLVQVGSQARADRYTYVPLVGLFIAVVWGLAEAAARWRWRRLTLALPGAAILFVCFVSTRLQAAYWQNNLALYSRTLQVTRNNALVEHNLGHALSLLGNQREAIEHFNEALRIKPGYPQAYFNRGNAYGVQGRVELAVSDYREAIRNQPNYEQAYYNLGMGLVLEGKLADAETNFLTALRYKPDYAEAHTKLGNLLLVEGRPDEAMKHLRQAVKIRPDYEEGQYYLGAALARRKEFQEAVACFRSAIKAKPDYASALNDLAWLLAACPEANVRNIPEAIRLAQRACELTRYGSPMYLDTLGAAQSEAGHFTEAAALTEKAAGRAEKSGDAALASQLRGRLEFYRAGRSYTQSMQQPP